MSFLDQEKKVSLEEFLKEVSTDADLGMITAIDCYHLVGSAIGDEVAGVQFQQGRAWSAKQTADLIRGRAKVHAQDLSGAQTYKVRAYFEGSAEPRVTMHFTIVGRTSYEHGGTEGGPGGERMQGQRLVEIFAQRMFVKDQQITEGLFTLLRDQRAELLEERAARRDADATVLTLIREQVTSNNEHQYRMLEFERQTQERRQLILLLPAIINYVSGRQVISTAGVDTSILESAAEVFRKLPRDQRETAFGMMPPPLQAILKDRLHEIGDRLDLEEQGVKTLAAAERFDVLAADGEIVKAIEGEAKILKLNAGGKGEGRKG